MAIKFYDGDVIAEGCVVRIWEHNGYDDSDFYADYLDIEKGTIETVEYNTTRFACGGYAKVDFTISNYLAWWVNARGRIIKKIY